MRRERQSVLQFLQVNSVTMLLPIFLINEKRVKAQGFHSIVRLMVLTSYSKARCEKKIQHASQTKITCLKNNRCCDSVCTLYQDVWKGNHVAQCNFIFNSSSAHL